MQTLKFKVQLRNSFVATYSQSNVWQLLPASDYCQALFCCLNCAQWFDYHALGSSQRLGGAAKNLIGGSKKHICQLSFEF